VSLSDILMMNAKLRVNNRVISWQQEVLFKEMMMRRYVLCCTRQ